MFFLLNRNQQVPHRTKEKRNIINNVRMRNVSNDGIISTCHKMRKRMIFNQKRCTLAGSNRRCLDWESVTLYIALLRQANSIPLMVVRFNRIPNYNNNNLSTVLQRDVTTNKHLLTRFSVMNKIRPGSRIEPGIFGFEVGCFYRLSCPVITYRCRLRLNRLYRIPNLIKEIIYSVLRNET